MKQYKSIKNLTKDSETVPGVDIPVSPAGVLGRIKVLKQTPYTGISLGNLPITAYKEETRLVTNAYNASDQLDPDVLYIVFPGQRRAKPTVENLGSMEQSLEPEADGTYKIILVIN